MSDINEIIKVVNLDEKLKRAVTLQNKNKELAKEIMSADEVLRGLRNHQDLVQTALDSILEEMEEEIRTARFKNGTI